MRKSVIELAVLIVVTLAALILMPHAPTLGTIAFAAIGFYVYRKAKKYREDNK